MRAFVALGKHTFLLLILHRKHYVKMDLSHCFETLLKKKKNFPSESQETVLLTTGQALTGKTQMKGSSNELTLSASFVDSRSTNPSRLANSTTRQLKAKH